MSRIVILQGHPDPAGGHLCHALAEAYAEGARAGGHAVETVEIARLDVPYLRNDREFETGAVPASLQPAAAAIGAADHIVVVFPLWLGTLPALLKAFLEQVMRPGVAFRYREKGFPEKLLAGKSARVVVTMGMPAFLYRWFYGAHGVRGLERNILAFVGIGPIRRTLIGGVGAAGEAKRRGWLDAMREAGRGPR